MTSTLGRADADLAGGTLFDRAYYALRERLLRGQLWLGAPVSSRQFVKELGVSHLTITQTGNAYGDFLLGYPNNVSRDYYT